VTNTTPRQDAAALRALDPKELAREYNRRGHGQHIISVFCEEILDCAASLLERETVQDVIPDVLKALRQESNPGYYTRCALADRLDRAAKGDGDAD
jgi:hypothetical protein